MQNNKQPQEFGDLLRELQCAKNDGRLKGLQILDLPAYQRPVVAKVSLLHSRFLVSSRNAPPHQRLLKTELHSFLMISQL